MCVRACVQFFVLNPISIHFRDFLNDIVRFLIQKKTIRACVFVEIEIFFFLALVCIKNMVLVSLYLKYGYSH